MGLRTFVFFFRVSHPLDLLRGTRFHRFLPKDTWNGCTNWRWPPERKEKVVKGVYEQTFPERGKIPWKRAKYKPHCIQIILRGDGMTGCKSGSIMQLISGDKTAWDSFKNFLIGTQACRKWRQSIWLRVGSLVLLWEAFVPTQRRLTFDAYIRSMHMKPDFHGVYSNAFNLGTRRGIPIGWIGDDSPLFRIGPTVHRSRP